MIPIAEAKVTTIPTERRQYLCVGHVNTHGDRCKRGYKRGVRGGKTE